MKFKTLTEIIKKMKIYLKHFLIFLIICSLILYFFTIKEGIDVLKLEGGYFKNIGKTFEYFFQWIIPYWWYILIIISLILGLVSTFIFKRLR